MYKFTTDTYTLKREILSFSKKISKNLFKTQRKFIADTNYGILASEGKKHEAYISHVKVQITASKKDIYLVLIYGITKQPMMRRAVLWYLLQIAYLPMVWDTRRRQKIIAGYNVDKERGRIKPQNHKKINLSSTSYYIQNVTNRSLLLFGISIKYT